MRSNLQNGRKYLHIAVLIVILCGIYKDHFQKATRKTNKLKNQLKWTWGLKQYSSKKERNINGQCVYIHVNKTAINDNLKDTRIALMKKTDTNVFIREFEISCFICWWSEYKTGESLEESGCHFLRATSVRLSCNWIIPFLSLNPKYQRLCLYKISYKHSYNRIHHKKQDIFLSTE